MLESLLLKVISHLGIDGNVVISYGNSAMAFMQSYETRLARIEEALARIEHDQMAQSEAARQNGAVAQAYRQITAPTPSETAKEG